MKAVVFVPGVMGTELVDSKQQVLWPPAVKETVFGYKRVDQLLGDDVVARDIIENVSCLDFYGSLLDALGQLGYRDGGGGNRLYRFPYDWRLDLQRTAQQLAARLDQAHADGATEIVLVAHSMGGLVTRLVLESGDYDDRPWFKAIRMFIAIATPHQGAPLALARVLGLDSAMGISEGDFRRIANDDRYPSAYQLLPAPTEPCCWDMDDLTVGVVDIYDPVQAERLDMNPRLLARARALHAKLGRRPPDVRYFYFAATGHETVTRVNVSANDRGVYRPEHMVVTRTKDAGDGTVPFWSALPTAGQKQVVVNEHSHAFTGSAFMKVFYRLLGGDLGIPLQSALDGVGVGEDEAPRLSMASPVVPAGRPFELLLIPTEAVSDVSGQFVLQRLQDDGSPTGAAEVFDKIAYEGPPVSKLSLEMSGVPQPGVYALRFEGQPADSQEIRFAVARA